MHDNIIEFDNVSKRYGPGHDGLKNVSLKIEKGEMLYLTGHSGAGKSTFLRLVALLERPTQGRVVLAGQDLNLLKARDVPYWRRIMGIVQQNPTLLPNRTVFENVALPLEIAGFRAGDIPRRVRAALDKVGLIQKENLFPHYLSSGEQQRLGIARAVVHKPRLLLADEPTGNLDPELSQEIIQLFSQFNQVGVTVLVATHDVNLLNSMPHRILTLKEGELA